MTMRMETVVCGNQQLDVPRGTGHVFFRLVNVGKSLKKLLLYLEKRRNRT
jgi:hypothetical protein